MSLKIGIVGLGNVATQNYIPFLAKQPDVTLGYYDCDEKKIKATAETFGGEPFDGIETLMRWGPDSVFVLTNEQYRFGVALELLKHRPKRMVFEKPLVAAKGQAHVSESDFSGAKSLLDQAEKCGCEPAMTFNYRFFDQTLLAKKVVLERDFGEVINFTALVHYACWSHCIDLVHHFAGPIAEVTALHGDKVHNGQEIEAKDVTTSLRLENGGTGTMIGTSGMQWQFPLFELILTFQRGRIHFRGIDGDMEILDGKNQHHENISLTRDTSRWGQYGSSFEKSITAYLESLRTGQAPPIPAVAGLRELQVEAAIKRSIAKRKPILLEADFPILTSAQAVSNYSAEKCKPVCS